VIRYAWTREGYLVRLERFGDGVDGDYCFSSRRVRRNEHGLHAKHWEYDEQNEKKQRVHVHGCPDYARRRRRRSE
jgi:hypothetical protein